MFLILLFILWVYLPFTSVEDCEYRDRLVAHGCGSVDGCLQTNCKEALLKSVKNGIKKIEIDLYITKDGHLVCIHDLALFNKMCNRKEGTPLYYSDFKGCKIYGKYTPMSFNDVIDLQSQYGFTIMTDKISDVKLLNKYIPNSLRNEIYVEAFSIDDYIELENNGYIPMYSATFRYKDIPRFITDCFKKQGLIDFVVVSHKSFGFYLRLVRKLGVKVAVYTQNNKAYINKYILKKADYIYIDSIR